MVVRSVGDFLRKSVPHRLNAAGSHAGAIQRFSSGFVDAQYTITGILQVSFLQSVEFLRNPSPRRQSGAKLFLLPSFLWSGARTFRRREIECLKLLQSSLHSRLPQAFLAACRLTHLSQVLRRAPHSAELQLLSRAEAGPMLPHPRLPVASLALRSRFSKPTPIAGLLSRVKNSVLNAVCPTGAGGVLRAGFAPFSIATQRTRHV
jgi:hypothetical protein